MDIIPKTNTFEISLDDHERLKGLYPNMGKNTHIGNRAVEIVKLFVLSFYPSATFSKKNKKGTDLTIINNGVEFQFEIKGTAEADISWNQLRVSGKPSHDALIAGMQLIRVSNVGEQTVTINFLKYGEDFLTEPEPRWTIKRIKK